MKRIGCTALVLTCLTASLASGCVRTNDGVAVRSDEAAATTSLRPQTTTQSTEDAGPSAPGVVATSRAPIPPDTVACSQPVKPAVEAVAQVSDPQAPRITVAVPDGWSVAPGSGDVGVRMEGPGGMSATVTIAQTQLDPAEAFTEYADKVMAVSRSAASACCPPSCAATAARS